jgi:hypothetical protein
LIADLAHYWHWAPHDAFSLTGTQIVWWLDQANRIIARERNAAEP